MSASISIAGRNIGPGHPCFVIAEAGVNHNGDVGLALKLIDAAAQAGADAVKFQAFRAERLATLAAPQAAYQQANTGKNQSQFEMLKSLELAPDDFRRLAEHCRKRSIIFLCTPFDIQSIDDLDQLDMPAFKAPSGELTNSDYLRHLAAKVKPIILSTGMATMAEIADAVAAIRAAGGRELVLLQCVTSYPADPAQVNLRAMATMGLTFDLPTGYSDHTNGIEIALAAVALGACVLEKHFTLDRNLPGPDHKASLEPTALRDMIQGIRNVESALGDGRKQPSADELEISRQVRRSLVLTKPLAAGQTIEAPMLESLRPGTGIPPAMIDRVLGRRTRHALAAGAVLSWDDLA